MKGVKNCIASVLWLQLHACSWIGTGAPPAGFKSVDSERVPFRLEVADEVNDGQRLHVLGSVEAEADWQTNEVVIKLTGLSEGIPGSVVYLPLSRVQQNGGGETALVKAGEKHNFSLSLQAAGITDYQLELLWGKDAEQILRELAAQAPGALEIKELEISTYREQCTASGCMYHHQISGRLLNSTNSAIQRVVLGVGFLRVPQGEPLAMSDQIPENEERIEIAELNLIPGASRKIKLDVDRRVPDANLVPVMRILSFE